MEEPDWSEVARPTWGEVDPGMFDRTLVVSPHFDDAVLGTSHFLGRHPGTTVVTVFGGRPARFPDPPTPWDASGGFVAGDDVTGRRREEDRATLAVLDARSTWLEHVEHQYLEPAERPRPRSIAPDLVAAVHRIEATAVLLPMGLANPDHETTHRAGILAREDLGELPFLCYEDAGYSQIPGLLAWRIANLFRTGLWPTPALVPIDPDIDRKRRAIACYTSQIPALQGEHALDARLNACVGEQYWRLAPPPAGWEALADVG